MSGRLSRLTPKKLNYHWAKTGMAVLGSAAGLSGHSSSYGQTAAVDQNASFAERAVCGSF